MGPVFGRQPVVALTGRLVGNDVGDICLIFKFAELCGVAGV